MFVLLRALLNKLQIKQILDSVTEQILRFNYFGCGIIYKAESNINNKIYQYQLI
jgi:hypothetical protein